MRALFFAAVLVSCGGPPPTFTRVQAEVFDKSCNFSSCHSGAGNNGLNLEKPSHAKLVNKDTVGVTGKKLVVPGKPDESYLYEKITKDTPQAGARMPNTGDPLEADRIQLVREWIAAGAENN